MISRAAPTAARLAASIPERLANARFPFGRHAETPNINNLDAHERGSGRPALAGARLLAFGPPGSELARAASSCSRVAKQLCNGVTEIADSRFMPTALVAGARRSSRNRLKPSWWSEISTMRNPRSVGVG